MVVTLASSIACPVRPGALSGRTAASKPDAALALGDDAERGPACLGVHAVDGDPEFVGEIVTDGGIRSMRGSCGSTRAGAWRGCAPWPANPRTRAAVWHRCVRPGCGSSRPNARRPTSRVQPRHEGRRGSSYRRSAINARPCRPSLSPQRIASVRSGGKRLHIHLHRRTGRRSARTPLRIMRLLGHRVATLQHMYRVSWPWDSALSMGNHDVAAQEPDRVLHAACLLVARVRVAEPGLQPVMLHRTVRTRTTVTLSHAIRWPAPVALSNTSVRGPRLCARTPCAAAIRILAFSRAGPTQ